VARIARAFGVSPSSTGSSLRLGKIQGLGNVGGFAQLGRGLLSSGATHSGRCVSSHQPRADLYFHEIGFRWSQRIVEGEVIRRTRRGRQRVQTLWSRVPPALQLPQVFRAAIGREMRRTRIGGIAIKSASLWLIKANHVTKNVSGTT
jgi:hypothetical protein